MHAKKPKSASPFALPRELLPIALFSSIVAIAAFANGCAAGLGLAAPDMPSSTAGVAARADFAEGDFERSEETMAKGMADEKESFGLPPGPALLTPEEALATKEAFSTKEPELLARWETENRTPLPMSAFRIHVASAGRTIRVAYEMVFENPGAKQLQGQLMVSLPQGASPVWFTTYEKTIPSNGKSAPGDKLALLSPDPADPSKMLEGESGSCSGAFPSSWAGTDWGAAKEARVAGAVASRNAYEETVRSRVDPALGEWSSGAAFSVTVFPIQAGGHSRMIFAFDLPARFEGGILSSTFPLPYAAAALSGILVSPPANYAAPSLYDTKTKLAPAPTGRWEIDPAKIRPPLTLSVKTPHADSVFMVGRDEAIPGARLVSATLALDVPTASEKPKSTGKALFLIDTSYSGRDRLYRETGKLLRAILESDESISEFALIGFDVFAYDMSRGFVPNTRASREEVFATVEKAWLQGATNLRAALELAIDARFAAAESCFLLSDAHVSWDLDDPAELERAYPVLFAKPWYCYSFAGSNANAPMFAALSRKAGATIQAPAAWDAKALGLAHTKGTVALGRPFTREQDDLVVEGDPQTAWKGMTLDVCLRVDRAAESVDVVVPVGGENRTFRLEIGKPVSGPIGSEERIAARTWARAVSDKLLSLRDEEADRIALALSQRFGLTNRAASLIMLESEADYERFALLPDKASFGQHELRTRKAAAGRPIGEPDSSIVPADRLADAKTLASAFAAGKAAYPWSGIQSGGIVTATLATLAQKPPKARSDDYPETIFNHAIRLSGDDRAMGVRIISTAVELKPNDDETLRLAGYGLMQLGMWNEAEALFRRIRVRRPFEAQGFLLEAIAAVNAGHTGAAIIAFEISLAHPSPRFGTYTREVAIRLYAELLDAVIASDAPPAGMAAAKRLRDDLGKVEDPPARLALFWNIDNTDIDLHVVEDDGFEVFYSNKNSPSGGTLYWDNTTGLGPELYEHRKGPIKGFKVFVHYFGTRSAEGSVPAATLVLSWRGAKAEMKVYATILAQGNRETQTIVPGLWK